MLCVYHWEECKYWDLVPNSKSYRIQTEERLSVFWKPPCSYTATFFRWNYLLSQRCRKNSSIVSSMGSAVDKAMAGTS